MLRNDGRKILVHPMIRAAIFQAEQQMARQIDTLWENWMQQIADLTERLDQANRELNLLRQLAAEARCPPDTTVH